MKENDEGIEESQVDSQKRRRRKDQAETSRLLEDKTVCWKTCAERKLCNDENTEISTSSY